MSELAIRGKRARTDWFIVWLSVPLVLILLLSVVAPMLQTVMTSVETGGSAYAGFLSGAIGKALALSVLISVWSVVTAGLLGTALAILLTRFDFPGRALLRPLALLPMALPPLIGALSFYLLYGDSGVVPRLLASTLGGVPERFSVSGIAGVILVHAMTMYPYYYLAVAAGLSRSDASIEEAALNLGAGRVMLWRTVLLPMLTPALVAGTLLTFMVSMASFTAPQLYNVQTLTTSIVAARTSGTYDVAAAQATVLSVVSILFLLAIRWYQGRGLYRSTSKGVAQAVKAIHGVLPRAIAGVGSLMMVATLVAPAAIIVLLAFTVDGSWTTQILPHDYTLANFERIVSDPRTLRPILVSSQMAAVAAAACVVVGVLAAWVVGQSKGWSRNLIDVMIMIPWALPGTVVGVNILTAFASPSPLNLGQVLVGSLWILPLAYFIRFLPLVFRSASAAVELIDPSLEEAARNLGAGRWRTLATVTVPLMYRGILAGALMALIQGFGEYVASAVIYPVRYVPLSVEIYNRIYSNEFGTAAAYGSIQMLLILVLLLVAQRLEGGRRTGAGEERLKFAG